MKKGLSFVVTSAASLVAVAGGLEGDRGIKFLNERLTLNPYVALSYTYDSNIDSSKHTQNGSQWTVNPGANFDYKGDNWAVDGSVFYRYHAWNRYGSQLNQSSYGERLKFQWSNIDGNEKGWDINFFEHFDQISQDDDMSNHSGRGIGRDSRQFNTSGVIERRINEHYHASLEGNYYLLEYENNVKKYAPMYGWKRLELGSMVGYTASRWADILLSGEYQWYWQDNDHDRDAKFLKDDTTARGRKISSDSKGWSVMTGLGTHATEKLSYRVMMGWSHFEYGSGVAKCDGWTYRVSGNWQVDAENTLNVMVLGSSYYQPSERAYGSATKVYSLSSGLRKSLIRDKVHATVDFAYRKEDHEYSEYKDNEYDADIWTIRFGLTYSINRMISVYGRIEYQTEETEGGGARRHDYDYDRWRGTVGLRLTY